MENVVLDKVHKSILKIMDEIVRICDKHNIEYFLVGGTLLGAIRHKGFIPWDDDLDIGMFRSEYLRFIEVCKYELSNDFVLDCSEVNSKYFLPFAKLRLKNTIYLEPGIENYQGPQGIWVDIFPLDNSDKQMSLILRVKSFYVNRIRREILLRLNFNKKEKRLSRFDKTNIYKSLIKFVLCWWIYILKTDNLTKLQQKIMQLNKNNHSQYLVNFGSRYGIKKQTMKREIYYPTNKMEFEGRLYKVPNDYEYIVKRLYGEKYMELPPIEQRVTHNPIKIKFEDGEEINFNE